MSKKILFVVTSAGAMSNGAATGLWFEEFATPYAAFADAGYAITVASPRGGDAPIDPRSNEHKPEWAAARAALKGTRALDAIDADRFDAVFMPGGHGTMFDLPNNARLGALLGAFADADKVIAAVCHGPAALVGAKRGDGRYIVDGKTITSFLDDEERAANLDKEMPFLLESALRNQGGRFKTAALWSDHVERDGLLITGQNPASSASTARAVMEALGEDGGRQTADGR
jgi:putative intracellular protease/amidase